MSLPRAEDELRVLVAAPTARDAAVTCQLLEQAGIECLPCAGLAELAREVRAGVGAILLTDAALVDPAMTEVLAALSGQASWSDVPAVIMTREREPSPRSARALRNLTNVTLLDRPSSTRSTISAIESALRARARQYQTRDYLRQQEADQAALRDADLRKDEFLATLAHELRNPLAAISTGMQVLSRSAGDADRSQRMVAMIDRQTRLLVKLIDDLLDVSRIATGKVKLQLERLDMRSVVDAALETLAPLVESSQHELRVDLPPEPVWVFGDAARLAQVVGNLVSNAVKYTPSGGRIAIELAREGERAVLRVADNGVGIPADMLPLVFEMFTQVSRTLDLSQGGLGIGLSLVRRLMELQSGTATATSPGPGQGSTFTIALPLVSAGFARAPAGDGVTASDAARGLRILIIDDNVDVADTLALLLDNQGHELRTEYSGVAGLEAAADFLPDVVFCDLGMPGIDGHEVASRLRSQPGHASMLLVAVTGWGTDDVRQSAQLAGFDVHITKPVTVEALTKLLAAV